MDPAVVAAIREGERTGRTDTPEFEAAVMPFYRAHVCRLDPWPEFVQRTFALLDEDPTVYHTMNGPTEFTVVGTIRDEVRPWVVEGMQRRLPEAEWVLFEDSSHMPHVEEPERFATVVGDFLARVDARG